MKKLLALLLVFALLFSLAACAGNKTDGKTPTKEAAAGKDSGKDVGKSGSYSEAYELYDTVTSALSDAFDRPVEKHNEALDDDNYTDMIAELFLPFLSIDMAFTATCGQDNWAAAMEALLTDATAEEIADNQYRITYKSSYYLPDTYEAVENIPHEMRCAYDSATGGIQFIETAEYEGETKLLGFVEFQPLGDNRYALQDLRERAIVEYDGKEAITFVYSRCEDDAYTPEKDSILGDGSIADAWAIQDANCSAIFTLDTATLTLWFAASQTEFSSEDERTIVIDR